MNLAKKIIAIFMSILVLFFTVLAILAIWEIVEVEHIMSKAFKTLFVIFGGSMITLFVFSVLYKSDK